MNLPETIQVALNYPPLLKFDVNTQEAKDSDKTPENKFSQAAIPAILIGFYKYTLTDAGSESLLSSDISSNWVKEIFPGYNYEIVERVAAYSNGLKEATAEEMNAIAAKTVEIIRGSVKPDSKVLDVKNFMAAQRSDIFLYLPEALRIGDLIDDTTVDDKTKKMEGPVSNLIKAVGDAFSSPEKDETLDKEI